MRKINYLFFLSLFVLVIYTVFSMQNRISIPVRLTFDQPVSCFLPLIILISFISGILICSIYVLLCYIDNNIYKNKLAIANPEPQKKVNIQIPDEKLVQPKEIASTCMEVTFTPQNGKDNNSKRGISKKLCNSQPLPKDEINPVSSENIKELNKPANIIECIKCKKEMNELLMKSLRNDLNQGGK